MTSELNTKFEAVAAALREASDALHAIGQKRHTQAVCEAALDDLAAIRQAIEAARQSSGQERGEAVAWMTEDGERCVTERTMAGARKDGGAMLSSLSAYVVPLTYAHPPAATGSGEAVAWLRKNGFRFNGDIEPQDDSELPLYTHPDSGRVAELEARLAASREREERMREALRHGRGIVPGGLWTSIELCAPNESPVKPGEYEDQYRFGWNVCRAEVLRNMAALAAEKEGE